MTLRVGLLADSLTLPAWAAECVRRVAAVPDVRIVVVVSDGGRADGVTPPSRRDPAGWAWRRYLARLTSPRTVARSPVLRPVSLAEELGHVPRVVARTVGAGRWREALTDESLAAVAEHRPDVLLRFAFGILTGGVLTLPRHGVWSFHFGDELRYRGGPAAFWEVYEGERQVGAILQRITDRLDGGVVLRKGFVPVDPLSYARTWNAAHEQVLDWPAEACRELVAGTVPGHPSRTAAPVRRRPTNTQVAVFAYRVARRRLGAIMRA